MILSDTTAERAVLAGVCKHGANAYFDIADLVDSTTFTDESNQIIYSCLKHLIDRDDSREIDVPSILSCSNELGIGQFFSNTQELSHLSAVLKFPVALNNVRKFAAKIRKLQIARMMHEKLKETQDKYLEIKGDEPISHILGIAEESIFDFTSILGDQDDSPELLYADAEEFLEDKADNQMDQVGIPTGFDKFDFAIGGGPRKGGLTVIGARPKIGKSLLGLNIGTNIAKRGVPILLMDTEMTRTDQQSRGAAMVSHGTVGATTINDIETGKFGQNTSRKQRLINVVKDHKDIPYYHKNIGGRAFEDQLSIMRRWIAKVVGLNDRGKAKDCIIIYDYLKLMDSEGMKNSGLQEFQLLGFMMTALHNFALQYEIPIIVFIQLNRDGVDKESTAVASGSDRIIWLCSSFSIYKEKSDEEIAKDGEEHGNRKLVPVISRYGEGLSSGDYINVMMKGAYAKLIEGKTAYELNTENREVEERPPLDEEDIAF